MDQMKMAAFLKELRTEKGLTQLQLAEQLNVSNRSVSRWETGSTLPDISILIELAEFYEVDIKEMIYGERKSEDMSVNNNESLVAVANYSNKANKKKTTKLVILMLLAFAVILILLTIVLSSRIVKGPVDPYPVYDQVYIDENVTGELLRSHIMKGMPIVPDQAANFCEVSVFSAEKVTKEQYYVYAWVVEATYSNINDVLSEDSAASYPCRFELTKENGEFIVAAAEVPGDGEDNIYDINDLFPGYVREKINSVHSDGTAYAMSKELLDRAKLYFGIK